VPTAPMGQNLPFVMLARSFPGVFEGVRGDTVGAEISTS